MTTQQEPRTFPFSQAHALDLDPQLAELRRLEPVSRVRLPYGGDGWLVTRHAEVRTVLSDQRFSRAATRNRDYPRVMPARNEDNSLMGMDPPDHTRLKSLAIRAFTRRSAQQSRPHIQETVDGLLDAIAAEGPGADLVDGLATPLPATVVSGLLGITVEDCAFLRTNLETAMATQSRSPAEIDAASTRIREYFAELIAHRDANPTDDVFGTLVRAHADEYQLSPEEIIAFGFSLIAGGEGTSAHQLACSLYVLLTHPEHMAALRDDPDLVPGAVEELLRFVPLGTVAGFPRIALEDVELGGVLIREGESVLVHLGSANRDESVFADPGALDFHRAQNQHVAFGYGVHLCIGAQIARTMLQVAVGTLVRRFPGLALAVPAADVEWKRGGLSRGPVELKVTW
ncbi:cytochrome P450 [Streptomyces sp. NPDC050560]|uniref:cytochrome P450 n=1 Tax=Streptomyces sp. NPDC050560 TaxID=3365630 RepID=UPI0037B450D3